MQFFKKISKEISVFGLVLVIFAGLFIYRQATYATYKTITASQLESKLKDKSSFILVAGNSNDNSVVSYQGVLTDYCTKNRNKTIYFLDLSKVKADYLSKTLKIDATTPCTMIIKKGKVTANKSGAMQYYYLTDFIKENDKDWLFSLFLTD